MAPKDRIKDATYSSFRCDYKPNKKKNIKHDLPQEATVSTTLFDCGTPTADMTLFKLILNSTISTKGAKCLMINLANFYLNTPMQRREYMRLKITDIPEEIIRQYKL
jgi:hypothetical protein